MTKTFAVALMVAGPLAVLASVGQVVTKSAVSRGWRPFALMLAGFLAIVAGLVLLRL